MSHTQYEIRSSRDGIVMAAARTGRVLSADDEIELGFAIGERFADRLPEDYRVAYQASWSDLFTVAGAQRDFVTVISTGSRAWSAHVHEQSVFDGEQLVVVSQIDDLTAWSEDAAATDATTKTTAGETEIAAGETEIAAGEIEIAAGETEIAAGENEIARPRLGASRIPSLSELAALSAIVVVAALFRFVDVASLPAGLHGDEAITGLEGLRIQSDGYIGVYTGSGLGQPTLMYYPLAVVQRIFGDGVSTIRGFAAFGGVVSVVLVWWATRRRFGTASGLGAAAALAIMVWSVHYSRIAFSLAWWPAVAIAGVYLVDRAIETDTSWRWALSGFTVAVGIYVYSAHWVFGAAVAVYLVGWVIANRASIGEYRRGLLVFVAAGLATIAPMVWYMVTSSYFDHVETIGIQTSPEWQNGTIVTKLVMLGDRYLVAWGQLIAPTVVDYSDGAGLITPIGMPLMAMAIVGGAVAVWRFGLRPSVLMMVVVAIMPIASAMTALGHGLFRRDLAIAPILAVFVGVFLGEIWQAISPRLTPLMASMIFVAPLLVIALMSRSAYFGTFRDSATQEWIFAGELIGPATVINEYSDSVFVNFYSQRHPFRYEAMQYLAPDADGEDRSAEFGENVGLEPVVGEDRPQLYVLIGPYTALLGDVRAVADGEVVRSGKSAEVPFIAYLTSP